MLRQNGEFMMKTIYKNHVFENLLLPGETSQDAEQNVNRKDDIR